MASPAQPSSEAGGPASAAIPPEGSEALPPATAGVSTGDAAPAPTPQAPEAQSPEAGPAEAQPPEAGGPAEAAAATPGPAAPQYNFHANLEQIANQRNRERNWREQQAAMLSDVATAAAAELALAHSVPSPTPEYMD